MQKNQPAINNFCTTLPAYITELLQNDSDRKDTTLSDVLQNILETYYGLAGWKEKLINDTHNTIRRILTPYGRDVWKEELSADGKAFKAFFFVELPFKSDIILEIDRARFRLQFIIHTTSKKYRRMFRSFYSYNRDGLLNRDMQLDEFARFATIGYKRNFTALNIKDILADASFAEKLIDDCLFLINIIKMHKWG
ncbi:MAG: hypothetical protein GX045_10485 [Clostridiaceae bacterium]|jgi:hypothetical protein|nr:hypothetical protein [Clostridiaceae bacterium]